MMGRYICKLASEGWEAEGTKGYTKDDLKCIGNLCNQNVGRCCEKRKELMSAPTYLPAEDMPLDEGGLANFDKYNIDKVGVPIDANDHDEEPVLEPTCPTGNIQITFGDYTVKAYVPRGKHDGDTWEEECGYGALDSKAKFKLVCKAMSGDLKWQLVEGQEGICEQKIGCDPANFQIVVPETSWVKEKRMKFSLPFQPNKFGRKVGVEIPCPKDKDIIGGHMEFYCNPNGKWSAGEHKCEQATEDVAPAGVPSKPAGPGRSTPAKPAGGEAICHPSGFQIAISDRHLSFKLPEATEAGVEVTRDCGAGMCGHVTFRCSGDASKWTLVQEMSSCKVKGACAPMNFGLGVSFGQMQFKLPGGQRHQEVSLPCPSPAKFGTAVFQCTKQDAHVPGQSKEADDECQEQQWQLVTGKVKCKQ